MRHAAAKRHEVPSWLPDKKFGKTIAGLSALAAAATCSTAHISTNLAEQGENPTTATDQNNSLPQSAVSGDSIDAGADQSSDKKVVDGAFYYTTCQIWKGLGQDGKFVCVSPKRIINPGVQPVGGANPDTQVYVNIDSTDQSTTA
ncbi:hypothetical protein HG438_002600 [Candidatus Saccharibacteria bacterium]|nr:hypothetical protein [Candidatus Saccharibacteria bacterium]